MARGVDSGDINRLSAGNLQPSADVSSKPPKNPGQFPERSAVMPRKAAACGGFGVQFRRSREPESVDREERRHAAVRGGL
jgi:hypothetical protein